MADSFLLDGLQLNDLTTFGVLVDGFKCPPPQERREWIGAADSEAQLLARTPLHENREVTIPIAVLQQANVDLVFDKIGQVVDKLVKASKYTDGVTLAWTAHGSSRTINFDVLAGEMPDLPTDWESGFQALSPEFAIVLTCKPYWRGTETLTSTTSSSTPFVTAELVNNSGDVPALGRLIVTDTATQSRRHVEWGLEGPLTYNSSTSLLVDSDNMVTSGFAGAQFTAGTAYDPGASGTDSIRTQVFAVPVAMCGTGNLSHVGTFRVKARVNASETPAYFRLTWQAGDGPRSANAWVQPVLAGVWSEVDLGTITIPVALAGTQRWTGVVEGLTDPGLSPYLYVDYLTLIPTVNGYGKARAVFTPSSGVVTGYDAFASTTAGSALNARVATLGGTWATTGDATDFAFADDFSDEQIKRSAVSGTNGRLAALGSGAVSDSQVTSKVYSSAFVGTGNTVNVGVVARYVDSSNYLRGTLSVSTVSGLERATLGITQVVAGVATAVASYSYRDGFAAPLGAWYGLRMSVFSSGRAILELLDSSLLGTLASTEGTSSALTGAGALATGKLGLFDLKTGTAACDRYYDDFKSATPTAEPIVIYSGRNMQIRHDDTIRQDSTGTYTGRPQSYRGSRFLVPVGTSRVLVKARRNDVDAAEDSNVTDATQIQVGITSRGLAVPRS